MNRRNYFFLICSAMVLLIAASSASAATITVRQDGTGDYNNVFDAVAASVAGDTIEIGPGTYASEPVYVSHQLAFVSTGGAVATVLSGQIGGLILRFIDAARGCRVEGLTFTQASRAVSTISAVAISYGSQAFIEDCVFDDNDCSSVGVGSGCDVVIRNCTFTDNDEAIAGTGGAYISGAGTTALVENCRFERNTTAGAGGGTSVVAGAVATIINCEYLGNSALLGGAIHCGEGSTADFSGCLFVGNSGIGAVAYYFRGSGVIEAGTLYDNTATTAPLGAIVFHETTSASAVRNIIVGTQNGPGIWADLVATADCCVFWDNTFGSASGVLPTNSVIADPVFCDPLVGDFTVASAGPAAAANSPCGMIVGARPEGSCEPPPPPPPGLSRIRVRQDGTGDYDNVFDAVDASTAGDTIEIGPGTYASPPVYVSHQLTFESTDGAAATVLSGQIGGLILRFIDAARGCRVEGLTFTQASRAVSTISALAVSYGSQVVVEDCVFDQNNCNGFGVGTGCDAVVRSCTFTNNSESVAGTGGAYISGLGTTALVEDCRFEGNTTAGAGGGTAVVAGAVATIVDCEYVNNHALYGGAIHCGEDATANVSGCLFVDNSGIGGVAYFFRSAGLMEGNTLYGNTALPEPFGAILIQDTQGVTLMRNIVAGTNGGAGVALFSFYELATVTETCNVYWDNDLGPVSGQALAPQSVQADPVFCDADNGAFTVSSLGAAAPDNSPCGQLVGAFPVDCAIEPPVPVGDEPVIISILDVPNDQGRRVRIKWLRSGQDEAGTEHTITGYAIYRYQEMIAGSSPLMAPPPLDVPRGKGAQIDGWDYLVTVPARGDSVYQTTVETLCDARKHKPCSTAFFVSAMTPDPLVYFDSAPDSGYSEDNLPPGPPSNLVASVVSPGIHLNWTAPDAPDIECYRVYRSNQPDFALDASNLVAEIVDTEWNDDGGSALYLYKVTTMDDGGNESEAAEVSTTTPVGPTSRVFALEQNVPNPFNPTTVIPYNVGVGGGQVTLRVYDVAGRLVTTLVDEVQSPGPKAMQWDGRDRNGHLAASGTYFYRLTGPGFKKTLKMTLVQ